MDRMLACEAGDPGSIPGESTKYALADFVLSSKAQLCVQESNGLAVYPESTKGRQSAFWILMSDDELKFKKITLARAPVSEIDRNG